MDGLRAVGAAVHRGTLEGDVVGQVVQPRRVVVGGPTLVSQVCRARPLANASRRVGEDVFQGCAGKALRAQARQQQDRAARPVVDHDVLGFAGRIPCDRDDHTRRLAVDPGRVVLK